MPYLLGALAVLVFVIGWIGRRRYRAMLRTAPYTCAQLTTHGPYVPKCEINGTALPASGGPLRAPFSGASCLWYQVKATAKIAPSGAMEFARDTSAAPFVVDDGTGRIEVLPADAQVDKAIKTFDQHFSAGSLTGGGVLPTPEGSSYRSYHYEEWTIPAGQGLYLLGAAAYDGRRLVMRRPVTEPGRERPFIISTRSEKQLRRQAMLLMAGGYGLGGLLLAGAALAAVLGAG